MVKVQKVVSSAIVQRSRGAATRAVLVAGLLTFATVGLGGAATHAFADRTAGGYVYVNDNTSAGNTVAGFSENPDGSLTPISGSPFNVGGTGLGKGLGSQDAIKATRDGNFLLVADAGSNQISVLSIQANGSLVPVPNSPFSSGGIEPVSIAIRGRLVYVANDGQAAANGNPAIPADYAGFRLDAAGQLTPLGGTVSVPGAANDLGDVLLSNDGQYLVGIEVNSSLIDSYRIDRFGNLHAAPNAPFSSTIAGPFGSAFRPGYGQQLYVSDAHGGALAGAVSAYNLAGDGTLQSIAGSPFADQQTASCWVAISPNGRYLFTANAGSGSISSYVINDDGSLSLLGDHILAGTAPTKPLDLQVDAAGRNLYGLDSGLNAVSMIHLHDGFMLENPTSPVALPTGANPSGITSVGLGNS